VFVGLTNEVRRSLDNSRIRSIPKLHFIADIRPPTASDRGAARRTSSAYAKQICQQYCRSRQTHSTLGPTDRRSRDVHVAEGFDRFALGKRSAVPTDAARQTLTSPV